MMTRDGTATPCVFHRVQLIRPRATSVQMNGLSMPPVGLMHGRFCLPNEAVAYLADSPETALYESLLRREAVSITLSELRRRCLVEFVTMRPLRLADLRGLAEPYPVLQSLRVAQTQELAAECRAMAPVSSCISLSAFDRPGIPGRGVANPRAAYRQRCGWRLARGAPDRSRC